MSFAERIRTLIGGPTLAIMHKFHKPPYGGGNQFLIALRKQLHRMGVSTGARPGRNTKALLMNSFNFDANRVRRIKQKHPNLRIVHRLAGPIGVYRGTDTEIDQRTQQINAELADTTILQSQHSATAYQQLGLVFKNPTVIQNTVDPDIFYPAPNPKRTSAEKIRLVAAAWSDNPKKGGPLLAWLDEHVDHRRFEMTFVGRTRAAFKNTRVLGAVSSDKLADIFRSHDIYIAPSQDDPCSNALLEALACGLPAAYLASGGHPELVGKGGEPFTGTDSILDALDRIASDVAGYRSRIHVPSLNEIARKYLDVLHIATPK